MLKQRGLSLVELMIALAMSLIILGALAAIFTTSTKVRQENNRFAEQIENGRIAVDLLTQDLRTAGFWDSLDVTQLASPATLPDPCTTDSDLASLKAAVTMYVQGYDNSAGSLSCITDVRSGTDVVVIRRAGTCAVGESGCTNTAAPYIQVSQCTPPATRSDGSMGTVTAGQERSSSNSDDWYGVNTDATAMTLHKIDCGNPTLAGEPNYAAIRPYMVHIYYVANNTEGSDGIPALKMAALGPSGFAVTTIATGVEQLQVEYGLDADSNGTPDSYTTTPGSVGNWRNVVSAKVHILSRNTSPTPEFTDTRTYTLGNKADSTANTYGPYGDNIRRHVFSTLVILSNPAGLKGS